MPKVTCCLSHCTLHALKQIKPCSRRLRHRVEVGAGTSVLMEKTSGDIKGFSVMLSISTP